MRLRINLPKTAQCVSNIWTQALGFPYQASEKSFFVPRNQEDALSHILSTSQVYYKHRKRKMEEKRLDEQVKRGSTLDSFLQRHNSHWSPLVTSQHSPSLWLELWSFLHPLGPWSMRMNQEDICRMHAHPFLPFAYSISMPHEHRNPVDPRCLGV